MNLSFKYHAVNINIQSILDMRANRPKPLCRFKQYCRNYKEGKECTFSHEKCSRGQECQNKETCMFFHQSASTFQPKEFKKQSKFQKPKSEVECKYGPRCNKKLEGKCGFKHTQGAPNVQQIKAEPRIFEKPAINKAEIPCHFGARCTAFPLGKCPYKHQMNQVSSKIQVENVPKKQQNHQAVFQSLCVQFLSNINCNQTCHRLHEYSQTKSISKIFSIGNCQNQIKKILIMEAYAIDQQPLYIVFGNNRIAFGQLTNMAKETGNQNVGNSSLVLKRWCDQDIQFQGAILEDVWIAKIEYTERADVLVCKCNTGIKLVAFNRDVYSDLPINEDILSVISLSSNLLILLKTGVTINLRFDFSQNGFEYKGECFSQKLRLLKKCNKNIQDEEIAVGVLADGGLCFINKQLQTHSMRINQRVIDVVFSQFIGIPAALVITEFGKLYAVNVLTFETTLLLSTAETKSNYFSLIALTNNHLFIAVDTFGVLVYNSQRFDKPIGVIAIDDNKWQIENDQRGNLVLMGQREGGKRDVSIFKVRKI